MYKPWLSSLPDLKSLLYLLKIGKATLSNEKIMEVAEVMVMCTSTYKSKLCLGIFCRSHIFKLGTFGTAPKSTYQEQNFIFCF